MKIFKNKDQLFTFLTLLLLVVFISSLSFAGGEKEEKAKESASSKVVLTFANDKGWTDRNDKLSPYSEKAIGVSFKSESTPDPANYQAVMKQALVSKNPPDMLTWWSKYRLKDIVDLGLLEDVTDIWEKHASEYNKDILNEFTFDGKVYAILYHANYWTIMYNKNVFKKFNLQEPQTWEEFMKICETLKKGGITPIATTSEGRWYSMAWFEEVLIRTDPDVYEGVCEQKIPYSDPRVIEAMKYWKDMIEKGYFPSDITPGLAEVWKRFAAGKIGMFLIGDWAMANIEANGMVPGKDFDSFVCPNINPNAGKVVVFEASPWCIPKNSPNKDAAKKLADYWLTPEAQTIWAKIWGFATPNKKATVPDHPILKKFERLGLLSEYRYVSRYYEGTPVPICEYTLDKLIEFMLHPDQMERILMDIDKYRKSL